MKILYIGNKLKKNGLTPTTIDILSEQLSNEGYNVKSFSEKKNLIIRILDISLAIFKNRDANLVLVDTYSTKAFYFFVITAFICKILKLKYVPYLHGGNLPSRLDNNSKICKLLFSSSFINIAPSGYLENEFKKRGYNNILLIPNTININSYPFLLREQTIAPKILWVRSFAKIYNPILAVDVLIELKKTYPEAELCMIGPDKDGSLEQTIQYANKFNVKVKFTGKLQKTEWIELSKHYNIFLNTTNFDNTPVSVIEAMALGLPIVSTNVGGLPFLINNNIDGILVEPNNSKSLSNAIAKLMQKKDFYHFITKNARNKVDKFDWDEVKKSWKSLFESIN